jgi:hypothetical protein
MELRSALWAGHRIGKGGGLAVKRRKVDATRTAPYSESNYNDLGRSAETHGIERLGSCQFSNIEYEGESHDVVDNKGPIFLSHDVYDK